MIFEGHVSELKQREWFVFLLRDHQAAARLTSFFAPRFVATEPSSTLQEHRETFNLFKELQVDVLTKRQTAYSTVLESEAWRTYPEIHELPTLDILLSFEDYSRVRERGFEKQTRRAQREKNRKEEAEKLRAQSGEVRWAFSCFSLVDFHSCWSSSPGRKVDPTEESTLHSALREAKQEVGMDADKIKIGRLGPPTQSLNDLSFECCVRPFRQVTLVKVFLH